MSAWNVDRYQWIEVWVEEVTPYFLMLGGMSDSAFEVFDPREDKIVHAASAYDDACNWLWEDEFTRVDGRIDVRTKQ